MSETKEKLEEVGFWVALGIVVFGIGAMSFAKPPLQTIGSVIFLTALLSPALEGLLKTLLRVVRWISRSLAG